MKENFLLFLIHKTPSCRNTAKACKNGEQSNVYISSKFSGCLQASGFQQRKWSVWFGIVKEDTNEP